VEGVLVTMVPGRIRMLTHADVTAPDIEAVLGAWRRVAAEIGTRPVPPGAGDASAAGHGVRPG
jgi:hypothetical protein